jgi:homoaconitase/3-isopropylmalate dehydratase large subunit
LFYASARGGLITKAKWREFVKENQKTMETFENEDRLDLCEMSIEMTHNILMTKGPEA